MLQLETWVTWAEILVLWIRYCEHICTEYTPTCEQIRLKRTQIQRNLHLDSVTNQKADFKVHLGRGYIDLLNRSKDELIFFKN